MISGVDFGEGADIFNVSASSALNGGRLELHLDAQDGRLIGTVDISGTGGWQNWQDFSCEITGAEGIHDLYFTFAGEGTLPLYNPDCWQFADSSEAARIRGDVNGDGIINAVDLTLAKRGILNGFADRAAEKAADVDRNQITDAKDIAWFRSICWLKHLHIRMPVMIKRLREKHGIGGILHSAPLHCFQVRRKRIGT